MREKIQVRERIMCSEKSTIISRAERKKKCKSNAIQFEKILLTNAFFCAIIHHTEHLFAIGGDIE